VLEATRLGTFSSRTSGGAREPRPASDCAGGDGRGILAGGVTSHPDGAPARPRRRFLLVGLTGGIATGKSTVSAMLQALGCVIIDADQLARQVVEPGQPAYEAIVEAFGRGVLRPDGSIDRRALGAIVFADPAARRRLEAITHPRIRERLAARLAELEASDFEGIVVFDAPVMIESGIHRTMDRLVVVVADEAAQRARQRRRDGATDAEAASRIASQMPLAEKAKLAHYVIDNSGDLAATRGRVEDVHRALLADLHARRR
jgi:dephospho-CoA kinase